MWWPPLCCEWRSVCSATWGGGEHAGSYARDSFVALVRCVHRYGDCDPSDPSCADLVAATSDWDIFQLMPRVLRANVLPIALLALSLFAFLVFRSTIGTGRHCCSAHGAAWR